MATIKIHDKANELRIGICGHFSGVCVGDVSALWQTALAEASGRQITIDITSLTGYDSAGRKLLRQIYQHGALFAAATPPSLVYLGEITATPKKGAVTVLEAVPGRMALVKAASAGK